MGIRTGIIKYNLNERGRHLIGQPRNFNIPAVCKLINGGKVQEEVAAGDMVGYLGHDVRIEYGINPPEVTLQGGALVPIEPAIRTVFIKAHEDGTIEHEAEFLDTPLGKKAQEWFQSKYGGFSSVFYPNERNPTGFGGFDYVKNPNFQFNRGYTLDSAASEKDAISRLTSRQRAEYFSGKLEEMQAVMDSIVSGSMARQAIVKQMTELNNSLTQTVESLSNELLDTRDELRDAQVVIDSLQPKFEPMMRLSISRDSNWVMDSIQGFEEHKDEIVNGEGNKYIETDAERLMHEMGYK